MTHDDTTDDDRIIIGWTCDDCDEALGEDVSAHDLVEELRKDHEADTGHTTTVEVYRERRIIPSTRDRVDLGEYLIETADAEIEWICPECERSGEELNTTKRCPDCDERLREVHP